MLEEQCALMHSCISQTTSVCVSLSMGTVLLRINTACKTKSNYSIQHIFLTQYAWSKIIRVSPQKSDKFSQ